MTKRQAVSGIFRGEGDERISPGRRRKRLNCFQSGVTTRNMIRNDEEW